MIDIRKLIIMIKEQKGMDANLSLEFECFADHEDPKPLVKVINYFLRSLFSIPTNTLGDHRND